MKLDLGGGKNNIPGYVNVDKYPEYADVLVDLEEGLPFADRSIDVINSAHLFEHINNFIPLMNECWRVLKDDGFLMASVPLYPGKEAVNDPSHVRFFTVETWAYFTSDRFCIPGTKQWIMEVSVEMSAPGRTEVLADRRFGWFLMRPKR